MADKQNPLLAKFEAKLEANYRERLLRSEEIDRIAFMKTIHEDLQVGPGRAGKLLNDFVANRMEIAEMIHEDYGDKKKGEGDQQLLHTKATIAKWLRRIFSKEDWLEKRVFFPLLKEYWED